MPSIRAVIFDLGHTLWDFAPSEASRRLNVLRFHARLEAALGDRTPQPAALDQALNKAVMSMFESWNDDHLEQPPSDHLVENALAALETSVSDELVSELTETFFGAELDMPVVEPDTLAAIGRLEERGLVMGCVSNTITLEEGILEALRRLGLLRYLRSRVASSAMGYRKPHPSLFQRALAELEVAPEEAVFVGDRLVDDIGGAQGVGMRAILTHHYRQEPLDGAANRPDAVIQRLGELPEALQRLEAQV